MKLFLSLIILLLSANFSFSNELKPGKDMTLIAGDSREVVRSKWGIPAQIDRSLKDGVPKEVWIYNCEYLEPCAGCTN